MATNTVKRLFGALVNWNFTDNAAHVRVSNSLVTYYWSGADDTNAPDASGLADFTVGVSADGASTGLVYHVINGNWVDTGATVANLYGG